AAPNRALADHHGNHGKKPAGNAKRAALVDVATTFRPLRSRAGRVDPGRRDAVTDEAAKIDRLVDAMHRKHSVTPNPDLTDEQFVRRAYLDICGTIPTLEEVRGFLKERGADKRAKLIDKLLNSEGYADHLYNYWADILRVQYKAFNSFYSYPFIDWLRNQIADNRPYDELVWDMVGSEGRYLDNPAVGYRIRDKNMPLIGVGNTIRVFLSTRVECAECHDHPFDVWTRKDFYQLAAFSETARIQEKRPNDYFSKEGFQVYRKPAEFGLQPARMGEFARMNIFGAFDSANPRLRYPKDYEYDDAKPKEIVKPAVPWGKYTRDGKERWRADFADWMTSPDNERFTITIVNRLWRRNFGIGLIEPYDDLQDGVEPVDQPLMDHLCDLMLDLDYDIKEFQRVLFNTKAYQRRASSSPPTAEERYYFPGPILRRMTAEQVWDSFLSLTVVNPYEYKGYRYRGERDPVYMQLDDMKKFGKDALIARFKQWSDFERTIRRIPGKYKYKGVDLVRSTELTYPLRADHFLVQFGVGTRSEVEGANVDGTVPQILTMFNGPVTHMLLEEGAVMYQVVSRERNESDAINAVFMTVLSRLPDRFEKSAAMKEVKDNGNAGLGNVIWSLVNTREFLFVQ
ncbi:MAG: DUF1549 domain-containing protein, partial [Planctomycetota bacterium]